ncbi:MAG: triose-phosphate isomerase [Nanoarchaeota archaeon]
MYKLIINLKTYKESLGSNAIKIARICKQLEKKAQNLGVEIILCPSYIDLREVSKVGVKTYSQHIDNMDFGAHTGYIVPLALKDCLVSGTLINHSEHNLTYNYKEIKSRVEFAKRADLEVCLCARNHKVIKKISQYNPDFIAVEPKELIGGDISITTANPELIIKSVKQAGSIPLLVGAGIKNQNDVKIAIQLGAKGILVASGVIKVNNIKAVLNDLLNGFDKGEKS